MSDRHPQGSKQGFRERIANKARKTKQWVKHPFGSRHPSPQPSGASTPQTRQAENDVPSNQQASDTPSSTIPVAEGHLYSTPDDLINDEDTTKTPRLEQTPNEIDGGATTAEQPSLQNGAPSLDRKEIHETDDAAEPIKNETPPAAPLPQQTPSGFDKFKDYASVTGSLLQLVLKKVPDAVDSNPVKVFFSLAKAVLELKEACRTTHSQYSEPNTTTIDWTGGNAPEEKQAMDMFQKCVWAFYPTNECD
ncbi:hypothetical protein BKA70DRAFT_1219286 [Coprinopsis sp. MPI-PUGE-AT-0042]|nr:hypothetical protein BKA70DRAFT_1219286 [Coprinopsis sp. MPI-PUGE-AT-0042]